MKNRKLFFLINGPIWLAMFAYIFLTSFSQYYMKDISQMSDLALKINILHSINVFICLLASFYVFYSFLVPRYLFKKRKLLFWIFSITYIVIIPIILEFIDSLIGFILDFEMGLILMVKSSPYMMNPKETLLDWLFWIIVMSISALLGYIFKLAYNSFKNEQLKKELEIRNHLNEIRVMKAKLNPHFLFNTINNIDTLIQSRPKMASSALSKLSDILRYMVYETENELIPIKAEIENLEKYIDLEKMRLVNPDSVLFTSTIKSDFNVPPLIFFPFVENGFKHSNLNSTNQKLQISISERNNSLLFECSNNVYEKKQESNFNGVGLELAKKRLDLLYPNRHELSIKKENNIFYVLLQIELN